MASGSGGEYRPTPREVPRQDDRPAARPNSLNHSLNRFVSFPLRAMYTIRKFRAENAIPPISNHLEGA